MITHWKKMHQSSTVFCDCMSDAIIVSRFSDETEICISMWEQRGGGSIDWKQKLRYIWRILTVGYPYEDDVIITPDEALQLASVLTRYAEDKGSES